MLKRKLKLTFALIAVMFVGIFSYAQINNSIFESIKHVDEEGREYWLARELQKILEYKRWDKFNNVIIQL